MLKTDPATSGRPASTSGGADAIGDPLTANNSRMSRLLPGCPPCGAARRPGGFTLIELMIAIVVLAIVAALAVPVFLDSVRKGRRSEAFAALTAVQQAQERYRANVAAYTTELADKLKLPANTPGGHYTIAINAADATGYTATATAAGSQASDQRCASLRVQVIGGNIHYGSACKSCDMASPPTDPNRCWSRQ